MLRNGILFGYILTVQFLVKGTHIDTPSIDKSLSAEKSCSHANNLETGVCTIRGYKFHKLPRRNLTIFVRLDHQNINDVNDRKNTYSMHFDITLYWTDPGIKSNFNELDQVQGYIPLSSKAVKKMWTPELFISNLSDYKAFVDSQHVTSAKILYNSDLFDNTDSTVEYKISFSATVHCSFNFTSYPKDKSLCSFVFGSQYENIRYIFLEQHLPNNRSITDLHDCKMSLSNTTLLKGEIFKNQIGLDIEIHRTIRPFIYRYYLPCTGGVLMASLSMTMPANALPARVGISVTVLLMMVNLYVTQMVNRHFVSLRLISNIL